MRARLAVGAHPDVILLKIFSDGRVETVPVISIVTRITEEKLFIDRVIDGADYARLLVNHLNLVSHTFS